MARMVAIYTATNVTRLRCLYYHDRYAKKDRGAKRLAYARAGIPEYWIIDILGKQLELFTQPNKTMGTYEATQVLRPGDQFVSPQLGDYKVDDLLRLG